MRRVVITGLGVVSPIATGRENYWQALKEGRNGVGALTTFDVSDCPVPIGAEIKDFDPVRWMEGKEAKRSDRVIQFAVAAADLAVEDARLDTTALDPHKFGVYIGSGQGGIETTFNNFKTMMEKGPKRVSPFFIPMMISNMSTAYVAIKHNAKGPNICVVTACATSVHSMGEAYHTIVRDDANVILAGGTEAALRSISIAGFAAMKALSTRISEPEKASRPFDVDRDGFVMGEGAGVLVLEELEHAKKTGSPYLRRTCRVWHNLRRKPHNCPRSQRRGRLQGYAERHQSCEMASRGCGVHQRSRNLHGTQRQDGSPGDQNSFRRSHG